MQRFRQFAADHDSADYLNFSGGVYWPGEGDVPVAELHEHLTAAGYDAQILTPAQVAERRLGLDPAALPEQVPHAPEEGWVDLSSLIRVLLEEFTAAGGRVSVDVEAGRATGVHLADGTRIAADTVVVATGADALRMLGEIGTQMPDATAMAVLVRTEPVDHGLGVVVNSPRIAVRPNVGGTLVLDRDGVEDHLLGESPAEYRVPDEVVEELLAEVSAILPGRPTLRAQSCGIGPKPIPGDGEPVIGPLEDIESCFVAFTHSGVTLALVVGDLLACEVMGSPEELLATFRPGRFTTRPNQ